MNKEFRKRIEKQLGREIKYSSDCELLAQAIEDSVGERLGSTTLKRMLGFTSEKVVPRGSTLDVLARYLGYADFKDMERRNGPATDISEFTTLPAIDIENLLAGQRVRFTYSPDRELTLRYQGNFRFTVEKSVNSKLREGDSMRITLLAEGFELLAADVERDGENLGKYHSAREGGLSNLELLP